MQAAAVRRTIESYPGVLVYAWYRIRDIGSIQRNQPTFYWEQLLWGSITKRFCSVEQPFSVFILLSNASVASAGIRDCC